MDSKLDKTIEVTNAPDAEGELSAGTILCQKYEIEKVLGTGGMGLFTWFAKYFWAKIMPSKL